MANSGSDEEDKVPEGAFDPDVPMSEILASIRKSIATSENDVKEDASSGDEETSSAHEEDTLLLTEEESEEDVLVLSVRADEMALDEQEAGLEETAESDEITEHDAAEVGQAEDSDTLVGLQENAAAISEDLVSLELEDPEGDIESLVAAVEESGLAEEDISPDEALSAASAALETPSLSELEEDSSLKDNTLPSYESRNEQALEEGYATVDEYIAEAGSLSSEEAADTDALLSGIEMLKEVGGAPSEMLEDSGRASGTDLPEELEGQELESLSLSSLIDEDEIENYLSEDKTSVVEEEGSTPEPVADDAGELGVADTLASIRQAVEEEVVNQDDAGDDEPYSFNDDPRFADVTSSDPRQRSGQDPYLRHSAVDDSDPFAANRVEEAASMDWERDAQAEAEPAAESMAGSDVEDPALPEPGSLSAEGPEATSAAFEQLARGITGTLIPTSSAPLGGLTAAEAFAADLMRPMIREWLDEHLPDIVEKLVKAELEERGTGDD